MNKIDNVYNVTEVTIQNLFNITVRIGYKRKTIDVDCYLFGERRIIELPIAELILYSSSAKNFINYLKEKMTEGLGLKEKSDEQD